MSGGLPARLRAMTNTEPENKEPQNKKKPITNEKQPPQQTGYATNKIKCGSGKFVVLRQKSLNASSCSSEDASSESSESHSRASSSSSWSTGRMAVAARRNALVGRRKQCSDDGDGKSEEVVEGDDNTSKKRCAWVTPTTDPCYAAFHDEEWGGPVHDDKKLFELLSLSGALAELTWPAILKKRHLFREVFLDFDPIAVSKLNERRIGFPGSPASSLLSELKLRSIIENARQILKVTEEFGSFDKYIWNFVNHKPIISQFRYSRQVPVKTPKAELVSKDLVKRGFRSVSPTVIYSFMQVAGLTNDHLISCFRFQDCTIREEARVNVDHLEPKTK